MKTKNIRFKLLDCNIQIPTKNNVTGEELPPTKVDLQVPDFLGTKHGIMQYAEIWRPMLKILVDLNAVRILEIGTDKGYSLRLFCKFLKATGGHIWSIDIADPNFKKSWMRGFKNYTLIKADSLLIRWKQPVDLLYLDGKHTFEQVYQELELYGDHAKVIMSHDIMNVSDECGVMEAFQAYAWKHQLPLTIYPGVCGLGVIWK